MELIRLTFQQQTLKHFSVDRLNRFLFSRRFCFLWLILAGLLGPRLYAQSLESEYKNQTILLSSPSLGQRFVAYKKKHGQAPNAGIQQAWQAKIAQEQAAIIARLPSSAVVTGQVFRAVNAVKIITPVDIDMAMLTDVPAEKVYDTSTFELDLAYSVPWTGASLAHKYGVTGKGIRIGILDSGVDYMHKSLGGTGVGYENNNPDIVEPGSFPNDVVVGGIDLVGDRFNARSPNMEDRIPKPDGDPISFNQDHGTHVASIAAGRSIFGFGGGVAPEADIYAIKLGSGQSGPLTTVAEEAMDYVLDPNGDFDLSDRLDVINMSFGQAFGNVNSPWAIAVQTALDMGVVVVSSAGNSGPTPYITSSPAAVDSVLSVAASASGNLPYIPFEVTFSDGDVLTGNVTLPLSAALVDTQIEGDVVFHASKLCSTERDVANKIVLISSNRPACGNAAFARYLHTVGAKALVVLQRAEHVLRGDITVQENTVPMFILSTRITRLPRYIVINGDELFFDYPAEKIASFSSQGPVNGTFKPSLSAPGAHIVAAKAISGDAYTGKGGTSMSAPHVAGAMALLKVAHPMLDRDGLNALAMNYASLLRDGDGNFYPLSRQGMGEIDIVSSLTAQFLAQPAGINLGLLSLDKAEIIARDITVKNFSDIDQHILVDVHNISQLPGVKVTHAKRIWVEAGDSTTIEIKLQFNPFDMSALYVADFYEYGGVVSFTPALQGETFNVGVQAVVKPITQVDITQGLEGNYALENISPVPAVVTALPERDVRFFSAGQRQTRVGAQVVSLDNIDVLRMALATEQAYLSPGEVSIRLSLFFLEPEGRKRYNASFRFVVGSGLDMRLIDASTNELVMSRILPTQTDSRLIVLDIPIDGLYSTTIEPTVDVLFSLSDRRRLTLSRGSFTVPLAPQPHTAPWIETINEWKTNRYTFDGTQTWLWLIHNAAHHEQVILVQ